MSAAVSSAGTGPPPQASEELPGRSTMIALGVVVLYGALRVYWQFGHLPERMSPIGPDLVVFTGWVAIALLAVAALLLTVMTTVRLSGARRQALLAMAGAVGIALVASGALLLLDVIGGLLPGLGIRFYPLGALSRAIMVGSGILLGRAARNYQRRTRTSDTPGRIATWWATPLSRTPSWALGAAYVAVAGCLVRIIAQAVVGFGRSPFGGNASATLFEVGFVLGGTVLPLSLVHAWGRVWPRWVPGLAGRAVPRRLVLWPATGISGALVVYFGQMLLQMIFERLNGRTPFPPDSRLALPEIFFWFAVPGYLTWGVGLGIAALAYARRVRTP